MSKKILGSLEVVLGANTAAFARGMRESQKDLKKTETAAKGMGASITGVFGKIGSAMVSLRGLLVGGLAAVGVYKLAAGLNAAAKEVDQLGKMSSRLGVGVQQLSALKFAAGEAGIEFEGLAKLFSRFQKTLGDTMGRGGSTISVGGAVIRLKDLNGTLKPTTVLLGEVADAMQKIGTQAERATVAQSLFGKDGGDKFLQLLAEGGNFIENLTNQTERARRLGVIFTAEDAKKMAAYNDALGRIGSAFLGLRVTIMREIAPAMTQVANKMAELTAAAPRVISALLGGDIDPEQRRQLKEALLALSDQAFKAFKGLGISIGAVLTATVWEALRRLPGLFATVLEDLGYELIKWLGGIYVKINEFWNSSFGGAKSARLWADPKDPNNRRTQEILATAANSGKADRELEYLREGIRGIEEEQAAFRMNLRAEWLRHDQNSTDGLISETLKMAVSDIRNSMAGLGGAADEIIRLGAAFQTVTNEAVGAGAAVDGVSDSIDDVAVQLAADPPRNFMDGIKRGLFDLQSQVKETADLGYSVITGMGEQLSSGLAGNIVDASTNFSNFGKSVAETAESVAKSVAKMVLQFYLLRAITGFMGTFLDTTFEGPPLPPDFVRPKPQAKGGAWWMGSQLKQFAMGGVVTRRTPFAMANGGVGEMGEAGPEAIMPLERVGGGKLGVNARGACTVVNIIDQRQSGQAVTAQERTGPDGRRVLDVYIRDAVRGMIDSGVLDRSLATSFGLSRAARPR